MISFLHVGWLKLTDDCHGEPMTDPLCRREPSSIAALHAPLPSDP
jgi:hypothetical protein